MVMTLEEFLSVSTNITPVMRYISSTHKYKPVEIMCINTPVNTRINTPVNY